MNALPSRSAAGFSMVEVALAVAVVAIGLVGIVALFPIGLDATRGANDATRMATIAERYIAAYQQYGLNTRYYDAGNYPTVVITNTSLAATNITVVMDSMAYYVQVSVTNAPYQISSGGTATISRVNINVWRAGSRTYNYVTEVARYVSP
jgi:uncharacterized protein (TIGR02598 family)